MAHDVQMVCVVHSESDVLLNLYVALSASGFKVALSSNTLDALDCIARSKPAAVLCRWEMPEVEASEFIRRAKAMSADTRIILCSAHADGEKHRQAIELGAADLLAEPLGALDVRNAFTRLVRSSGPYEAKVHSYDWNAMHQGHRYRETCE